MVLITPLKSDDPRTNNEIKKELCDTLKKAKSKVKIRGIRQMRKTGLIVEINEEKDETLMKGMNLECIQLKVGTPRKQKPQIII